MAINPNLLMEEVVKTASNACDADDVVVDGRRLTDVQETCLFMVIGRAFVKGRNMTRDTFDVVTARLMAEESPSIDVVHIGDGGIVTISRDSGCIIPTYRTDADDYNVVDIFLPPAEYDALIESINIR